MSTGDRLVDYLEEIFNGDEEDMDSEKVADYIRTTLGYSDTRRSLANAAAEKLVTQVSSLTAENERLRKERDEAQEIRRRLGQTIKAFPDAHHAANLAHCRDERDALRAEVSSLRELESAARAVDRAWREESGTGARVVAPLRLLAAAVDALPPTPPATEGSDVQDR